MLTEHVRLESSIDIATVPDKHTIISYSLCKKKLREKCVTLGFNNKTDNHNGEHTHNISISTSGSSRTKSFDILALGLWL